MVVCGDLCVEASFGKKLGNKEFLTFGCSCWSLCSGVGKYLMWLCVLLPPLIHEFRESIVYRAPGG
jgi:hypothetical protein